MFDNNLKAIRSKNQALAEKLAGYDFNDIEIFETPSKNYNLNYKGVDLHKSINPVQEAVALFNSQSQSKSTNTIHIVFGLGLGYLFKRTYVETTGKVIIFEPFLDVLKFTSQYVDFQAEFNDNRVFICSSMDEVLKALNKKYLVGDIIEVLFLPSYIKLAKEALNDLSKELVEFIESKKMDQGTILNKAVDWGKSCIANLHHIKKALPVDYLQDKFADNPVVIVSAGPSLEENIPYIKKYRNKLVVITINTALKGLLSHDIIPDICVISEHIGVNWQLKGLKNLDKITYILHPRAQGASWVVSDKQHFVYLTETDGFASWYNELFNNKYHLWPSAGTVSLLAFYIAIQVFKAPKVLLVGQDLAFVNNLAYSPSTYVRDEKFEFVDGRLKVESSHPGRVKFVDSLKMTTVKNSYGEDVLSREDYSKYIDYYEEILENELPEGVDVINTSLKGAYIKGMSYASFEDAFNTEDYEEFLFTDYIEEMLNDNNDEIKEIVNTLDPAIESLFKKIKDLIPHCNRLLVLLNQFNVKYKKNPGNNELIKLYKSFYQKKEPVFNYIKKHPFLFFIIQKYCLDYVQNFIVPSDNKPLTINDIASNFEQERILIDNVLQILKWIDALDYDSIVYFYN